MSFVFLDLELDVEAIIEMKGIIINLHAKNLYKFVTTRREKIN